MPFDVKCSNLTQDTKCLCRKLQQKLIENQFDMKVGEVGASVFQTLGKQSASLICI